MKILLEEHLSAILGIIGTLLGVILGALLNKISRLGSIKFYLNKIESYFVEQTNTGSIKKTKNVTEKTINQYISLNIDLLNTSEYSKKFLRDINLEFQGRNFKKTYRFKDESTRTKKSGLSFAEQIKNINLHPKELINLSLSLAVSEDYQEIQNSTWYLTYKTKSNKKKRFKIQSKK